MSNLKDLWTILRSGSFYEQDGFDIPTFPTEVVTSVGAVRLSLGRNGELRVLFPLKGRERTIGIDSGGALLVNVSTLTNNGRALRFLDIVCTSKELETVFIEVVNEILVRVSRAKIDCVDAAKSTIEDFRSLLENPSVSQIGINKSVGLVGELLILNRLLDHSPSSWRAWRGPMGDRHDFRKGNTSLEVKTTLRHDCNLIDINGLDQLEIPAGGSLHLLKITLEEVKDGLLNVSSLAHSALSKVDDSESLRKVFCSAGCDDIDAPQWYQHSFRLESEIIYKIVPGFPRLTSSMLILGNVPAGVSGVSYKIDLSYASSYRVNPDSYSRIVEELC